MPNRTRPKFLGVWLSQAGWQAIENRTRGKGDRSDVVRRLLSYATQHMPEGWKP
jgi:hypothetical protein